MENYELIFKKVTGQDFNRFYQEYKPKLTWHLSTLTQNLEEAEDFADEAFIQGLNKLDQYDKNKGAQIHTWIYTIGRNLVIKSWKDKKKLPSISIDKEYENNLTLSNFLIDHPSDENFLQDVEFIKKARICEEVIYGLPTKYREVMIMRELQKLQYKEISIKLNRNLSTVKSQIKKGRELVIKKVEKKFKSIDNHGLLEIDPIFDEIENYESSFLDVIHTDED